MTTLMQASRQWATRPADERFLSLLELQAFTQSSQPQKVRFAPDSALEGGGFELSVPRCE
jgi:hypothetical protein